MSSLRLTSSTAAGTTGSVHRWTLPVGCLSRRQAANRDDDGRVAGLGVQGAAKFVEEVGHGVCGYPRLAGNRTPSATPELDGAAVVQVTAPVVGFVPTTKAPALVGAANV